MKETSSKFFLLVKRNQPLLIFIYLLSFITSCKDNSSKNYLFQSLDAKKTGLNFTNKLTPSSSFNMFNYMYFYNGAGVGAGDFNNDGLTDIFFASNQGPNKIYLNQGKLKFKDVTKDAGIPEDGGWSTGVSIVDINNDGLLDIYVCRVGDYENLKSRNELLICKGIGKNGVPFYANEAKEYGIDFSGFSTQAAFFDYDQDGDLDMFLLNHTVHQNGSFAPRANFIGTYDNLSGDRIFRNDENKFTDVTKETGINSSKISYGLGIAVSDIDLDGYPDVYIGNDFHENDYLYINQHNGTFKDEITQRTMHTSEFTMGVDVADVNNDAYPDIISMDMLPYDPYILKRSLGEDAYDVFNLKINYGYYYQYSRNNLQLNRRNGMFSEVGLYAGIYATDWSWSPLWMDFDNDGLKDLFVSNGIPKRLNDMDYVSFVSGDEIQQKIKTNSVEDKDMALIKKFPEIKLPNKFFHNNGNVSFEEIGGEVKDNVPSFSNGAVYADLDNDGDLDVVVNNIDEPVLLYENKSNDKRTEDYVDIHLKGDDKNINAVGAKIILFTNTGVRTYESYPVHGFMSSMEVPIHIGLMNTKIDSAFLIWPDNTFQNISFSNQKKQVTYQYTKGLSSFNYKILTQHWQNNTDSVEDITKQVHLNYKHKENSFPEFDREPLIPHMLSAEGPALAVGDINHDGLDDIFLGSSKREKSVVFLQTKQGKFIKTEQPALDADRTYEDVDATWADVNNDSFPDLIVASGGNEFHDNDTMNAPRVYLNNGKGSLTKLAKAFADISLTASCVIPYDFNNDGFVDLFIGARTEPWNYGEVPQSYLLVNDKKGHFKDVTAQYNKELSHIGFVTNACWYDIDKDGDKDLLVTLEWGGVYAFINDQGKFITKQLTDKKGWWNFILPVDINNDGNIDFIAGNLGLNSRLKASEKEPVRMYYADFDNNGKKEQIVTYYLNGREIPFANKEELQRQIPVLKKRFLYAEDFAKASLEDMFGADKLKSAAVYSADYFANSVLINDGRLNFKLQPLPWQAQLTTYRDAATVDANDDGLPDILLSGNYYDNNIQAGRYDADFGSILLNKGQGNLAYEALNGLVIKGEVRHIKKIIIANKAAYILARNNDSTMVIRFLKK